jgi:putative ABC transport system permease protein
MNIDFLQKLFRLSWKSLQANAFRSFLTTLGIMIGTTTSIIVVALGEGAKKDIEAQYSNMSVTTILVNAPSTGGTPSKLSIDDIPPVRSISTVADAVPMLTGKVNVSTSENVTNFTVVGTYPEFARVANLTFADGSFFTQDDEDNHNKVAILGATVAEELYGTRTPKIIGDTVTLGKKEFEIIGVAEYKGGAFGPVTIDESVFTPYSSSYRYVLAKMKILF